MKAFSSVNDELAAGVRLENAGMKKIRINLKNPLQNAGDDDILSMLWTILFHLHSEYGRR